MPKYKVIATEYIFKDALIEADSEEEPIPKPVSYTHLTLPTILRV